MNKFSMTDPRWSALGIGHTVKNFGCLVVCISMIVGKTPDRVLFALNSNDCFDDNCMLLWEKAVKVLGLKGYTKLPADTPVTRAVIAETHDNAKLGAPQHFFVLLPNKEMVDPLTGVQGPLKYNVVSQRLIT